MVELSNTKPVYYFYNRIRRNNSGPLVYIDDDINSANAIALMHFLSLNPKIGTPNPTEDLSYDDPDYKPKKETSDELLQIWKMGQAHLNNLCKI